MDWMGFSAIWTTAMKSMTYVLYNWLSVMYCHIKFIYNSFKLNSVKGYRMFCGNCFSRFIFLSVLKARHIWLPFERQPSQSLSRASSSSSSLLLLLLLLLTVSDVAANKSVAVHWSVSSVFALTQIIAYVSNIFMLVIACHYVYFDITTLVNDKAYSCCDC